MQEWQKRKKHHEDIKSLGEKNGIFMDKNGFIWKWHGKLVLESLNKLGHSAISYERCTCKEGKHD